jgi:hypothetical protein
MSEFAFDENNLTINTFSISYSPTTGPTDPASGAIVTTRDVFGNGKMTGIVFVGYSYADTKANFDADDVATIEKKIHDRIQFYDLQTHAAPADWTVGTEDNGFYHDTQVATSPPESSAIVTPEKISNSLAFYLMPPAMHSNDATYSKTIYAFYVPEDPGSQYSDSTASSNRLSTYHTNNVEFDVIIPKVSTSDFSMVNPHHEDEDLYLYVINYASPGGGGVGRYIKNWDFTRPSDDAGINQVVDVSVKGSGKPILSLFTQAGDKPDHADCTIFALPFAESGKLYDSSVHPPVGSEYTTTGSLGVTGSSTESRDYWVLKADYWTECTYKTNGIVGVPVLYVHNANFTYQVKDDDGWIEESAKAASDDDFLLAHVYATDSFGTTLNIGITLSTDDAEFHNKQGLDSVVVKYA